MSPPYSHQSQGKVEGSTGTSLTNFVQQGWWRCDLNTAFSFSTTTSLGSQHPSPNVKTFCKFEPQIWLEIITSRDAKSACFKGSRTSCREIIFGIFWPNFGQKRSHHVMDASCRLIHFSGKTSHFENYRYSYSSNIVGFGERVLGDIRDIPTQKLRLRSQHQKLRGIWLGRNRITNEHILALPLQYSEHPSKTTWAYKCRRITRVPSEEQRDLNFPENIYWPQLSDDIDFKTTEHFRNHQKQNIATRAFDLQSYDIILKQLLHLRINIHGRCNHHLVYLNHLRLFYLEHQWSNNRQLHFQLSYFKDHLQECRQLLYLTHLQQYIIQQASTTTNLVVRDQTTATTSSSQHH